MFKLKLSKKVTLAVLVAFIFFFFSFLTLNNYGISWDEPTHFKRGQGYLWYILTGDNDYHKLPKYDLQKAQTTTGYHERSIYQDDVHNAAFYRTIDGGHPPLADILSSASNMIFYQRLGWLGDVESYHLFEIVVAGLGVGVLFLFVYESFGFFPSVLSALFYSTYPMFWAESHFNIKDPIETSWIIITLYFFWKGITKLSAFYIFVSSVFAGFALATKFNVVFLPFMVIPWLVFIFITRKQKILKFIQTKKFVIVSILFPLTCFAIFYFTYPFLWEDPIANIGKVFIYYERISLDPAFANSVLPEWKFYALRWVLYTMPPLVLTGLICSAIFFKKNFHKHGGFLLLVWLWFLVTISRVSIPGVNIYGGIRQIMEYVPAVSILAGVGFSFAIAKVQVAKKNLLQFVFIILALGVSALPIIHLHPNENVYFNFLAGGLKGAIKSGMPAAGNSFGNTYYQGLKWVNENAPDGAKLTIIQGTAVNVPAYIVRTDIDLSNGNFSGINRGGEYAMALIYNYEHRDNFYSWEYINKFLKPVYEVKVDGTPILKVWKNDLEHTNADYMKNQMQTSGEIIVSSQTNSMQLNLSRVADLSSMQLTYDIGNGCVSPEVSTVETSLDGKNWVREGDPLSFAQIGKRSGSFSPLWVDSKTEIKIGGEPINYYFAARKAAYIRINAGAANSCILINPEVKVFALE